MSLPAVVCSVSLPYPKLFNPTRGISCRFRVLRQSGYATPQARFFGKIASPQGCYFFKNPLGLDLSCGPGRVPKFADKPGNGRMFRPLSLSHTPRLIKKGALLSSAPFPGNRMKKSGSNYLPGLPPAPVFVEVVFFGLPPLPAAVFFLGGE